MVLLEASGGKSVMIARRGQVSASVGWWEWWATAALVATLLVVGHNLLMTGNAHAASNDSAPDARVHAPVELHPGIAPSLGECGSVQIAAQPSNSTFNGPSGSALLNQVALILFFPSSNIWTAPPTCPPQVRRALLQIYRM